jgi:hypothetical protein
MLRFLETVNMPTPKLWDWSTNGEESLAGVSYILMDYMPGKVLDWSSIDEQGKKKVISQLADIHIELRKHEFSAIGCMHQIGDKHIGPFARECLTDFKGPSSEIQPLGPFSHLQGYYKACITLSLDLIFREEIYTDSPVETYLIYQFLYDRVSDIYLIESGEKEACTGYHLKHSDDKGFHILMDAESNITALIDWEWAFTAPATLAFNSPMLLLPTSEFFSGETIIDKDEETFAKCLEAKGAGDMANYVREGRIHHQVAFLCTLDFCLSFEDLVGVFGGLRKSVSVDHEYEWEEWKKVALKRYANGDRLRDILERSGG